MTYQDFVEKATEKGWTLIQDYTNNIKQIEFATKFEIWVTPDSDEMYFIEVWSSNSIVAYKYIDDFNF
jgi:hypothetical protein